MSEVEVQADNSTSTEKSVPVEKPTTDDKTANTEKSTDKIEKPVEKSNDEAKKGTTENVAEKPAEDKNDSADESNEEISKLEGEIIRQVEYYFSDANLNRDKFLLEQISKDTEQWVPLSVLLTFKRLAALSTDEAVIVKALAKSDEGLIEISEDKTKIRRHPERPIQEFNEEIRKEILTRTAYVKGFPLNSEMSEIIDFFKPYEKVLNIVMRKYLDKPTKSYKFKGSVFVTFAKKEQCDEFINKEKIEYKGKQLVRKWQTEYVEEKKKEHEEYQAQKKAKMDSKKNAETNKIELPKGTVLQFKGCDENTTRESIKEAFAVLKTDVAYVEYTKGDSNGYVRLTTENAAAEFLNKLEDNKLKVESVEITLRKLTEDEEKLFLEKVVDQMKSRRNNPNKNKNRKRGRPTERSEDEPKEKK